MERNAGRIEIQPADNTREATDRCTICQEDAVTKSETEKMWLSRYRAMDRRDFMITSLAAGA